MAELKQRFPAASTTPLSTTRPFSVRESIHEVQKTLFEAIALVVLVVLIFLQNLARRDHPTHRDSGFVDRHIRSYEGFRVLDQQRSLFGLVLAIGIVGR